MLHGEQIIHPSQSSLTRKKFKRAEVTQLPEMDLKRLLSSMLYKAIQEEKK